MKKNPPEKPRITTVFFEMPTATAIKLSINNDGTFTIASQTGEFFDIERSRLERSYEHPKGRKVISTIPLLKDNLVLSPETALHAYRDIVVIDANARQIRGRKVHVAAVLQVRMSGGVPLQVGTRAYEFRDVDCNPDLLAIKLICEGVPLIRHSEINDPVLFVIDSDLGLHEDFRNRTKPLVNDWHLPEWAQLAQARDKPADSAINKLLKRADHLSTSVLEQIASGAIKDTEHPLSNSHSNYIRLLGPRSGQQNYPTPA